MIKALTAKNTAIRWQHYFMIKGFGKRLHKEHGATNPPTLNHNCKKYYCKLCKSSLISNMAARHHLRAVHGIEVD
jgi:hypothetical protein